MSEKNNSIVEIKIAKTDRLVVGAVQKVLNQIIILKSAAAEPITLTFGDIESVQGLSSPFPGDVLQKFSKKITGLVQAPLRLFQFRDGAGGPGGQGLHP